MSSPKNKVLLIFSHPVYHKSRINKTLVEAVKDIDGVTVNSLYDQYPDYHIDIKHEQKLLLEHDVIIWQHPFYWYSAPPLFKEWIDLVLQHNFAYGHKGTALKGKYVMTAISAGGSRDVYQKEGFNRFTIREFLSPFDQTAYLCKMEYLPPFVVHGTHLLEDSQLDEYVKQYKEAITLLTNGFDTEKLSEFEYINDYLNQPHT